MFERFDQLLVPCSSCFHLFYNLEILFMCTYTHTQCRDFFPLLLKTNRESLSHWLELCDFPCFAFCGHRKWLAAVLFNMSCPRLAFGDLHLLSLGLLEILLPCLGPDPQLNLLLPPVPLLTNYSGPLIRTSEILFPFISWRLWHIPLP